MGGDGLVRAACLRVSNRSRGRLSRAVSRGAVGFAIVTASLGAVGPVLPAASGGTVTAAAVAAPSWSIAASPNPVGSADGQLRSVACTSTTDCFAVGQTHGVQTLIERWNGTNWIVVPSPDPTASGGINNNDLSGVACSAATNCFAVGSMQGAKSVLIERWNGTAWSVAAVSATSTGVLSGVSCFGATSCQAVGARGGSGFAMRWNGTSWTGAAIPKPSGATASRLASVKCVGASNCMAVGSYDTATATRTLIERWNGTSWAIVASANPAGATSSRLSSIACPSTSCFAVGVTTVSAQQRTLIERWNGTAWTIMSSPNPTAGTPALSSVGCYGALSCFAVGSKATYTLVERWNGTAWSIVTSPNAVGAQNSALGGVNCISASECFAVGRTDARTMTQRWNGSAWSIQADPLGGSQSRLEGVACPTSTSCFAVGSYLPAGHVYDARWQPLIERWNGSAWTIVASPNPAGSSNSRLVDVDCVSTTSCFAVGATTIGGLQRTLVQRWNGTTWTIVTSPNPPGTSPNGLADIDCTTAAHCFAVGATNADSFSGQTLIERWNGTTWMIASGAVAGALQGVSCVSTSDCLAVGDDQGRSDPSALAMHWNGTTWTPAPGPQSSTDTFLTKAAAVYCTAANFCAAVGTGRFIAPHLDCVLTFAAIGTTDGTGWTDSPRGYCGITPLDVTCTISANCTEVGTQTTATAGYNNTVVLHWDGAAWVGVASPNPTNANDSSLAAVACASATNCFAVGTSFSDAYQRTLIERYG
jgi:hypothetical protein